MQATCPRSGSRCRQASHEELRRLFQGARSLYYDEQPVPGLTLRDLDLDAVQEHLESAGGEELSDDLPRLLRAWGLCEGGRPTVGRVVLFGRRPQDVLESSRVVVAAFRRTDTGDDLVDRKDINGGLFRVIEQVESFLALHLRVAHEVRGFQPERKPEIPPAALREAVVNALVHRDYTIPAPVRVFVLPDRVEVHAPGQPPNTVDVDAMLAGVHVPRNPPIYSRVADAPLVTRAGTGIRGSRACSVRHATGLWTSPSAAPKWSWPCRGSPSRQIDPDLRSGDYCLARFSSGAERARLGCIAGVAPQVRTVLPLPVVVLTCSAGTDCPDGRR